MVCPSCMTSDDVNRILTKDGSCYSACVICLSCMRQVRIVADDPSDATKRADDLFRGNK